jgi:hypothetical protein
MSCVQIDTRHPVWGKEVLESCRRLIDMGVPSLSWDQYFIEMPQPNVLTLTRQIRAYSRQRDPQSTFSAEELSGIEVSCDYLDYTWNWDMLRDCRAATSVFSAPRINVNVDASPGDVKWGFALNRYLNIQPRRPDGANGSDLIGNHRPLSEALKQTAKLRAQFLPYFTDGTLIGECILSRPCAEALVAAYALGDKVLAIVLNHSGASRTVTLPCDPRPWLPATSGGYRIKRYDGQGRPLGTSRWDSARPDVSVGLMESLELALFEWSALPDPSTPR